MPIVYCRCGKKYQVDSSRLGKKAKCKQCGEVFFLVTPDEDEQPIPFELDELAEGKAVAGSRSAAAPQPPPALPPMPRYMSGQPTTPAEKPRVGTYGAYFASLPRVFWVFSSAHNVKLYLFSLMVLVIGDIFPMFLFYTCFGSILGLVIILVAYGSFAAFSFNIVHQSAEGQNDLPSYGLTFDPGEWWGAVIVPLFGYIFTYFLAAGPALIYTYFIDSVNPAGGATGGVDYLPSVGLLLLGLFTWPMLVLTLALGGAGALLRLGDMCMTVMTTFPAYLFTVILVYGTAAALIAGIAFLPEDESQAIFVTVIAKALMVYAQIVTMRAIGIYYYVFQEKFAWMA